MRDREVISILRKVILGIICVVLLGFPLLFLTTTTDPFSLPRQIVLVISASVILFLWTIISVFQKKIVLRTNPFTLPLGAFTLIILVSAVLSKNMYDSLAISIPVVAAFIFFFVLVNVISDKKEYLLVLSSLILGGALATLISVLYYFKLYFIPIAATKTQYFTTFGSPIQHLLYIAPLLIICAFAVMGGVRTRRIQKDYDQIIFLCAGVVFLIGVGLMLFQIMTAPQKPNLLPYTYGFQIATAAISQDSSRFLVALPFGSGYGTFLTDYTRFKFPTINSNPTLWNYPFTYSSSFVLEILATTGLLGFLSFLFLLARILRTRARAASPLFLGLVTILVLSFFLPFSLMLVFLLFTIIGLYTSYLYVLNDKRIDTIRVSMVALKEGLFSFAETGNPERSLRSDSRVLPIVIAVIILVICGYTSYLAVNLLRADTKMAQSLAQNPKNSGEAIYNLQRDALVQFPYRADYYRTFSQLNLALANSISQGVPQGTSPSAQVQQTVSQLLQQGVGNARTAVSLAPITAVNWDNLGGIYRSLIGVGQNADQFAVAAISQAIALDPQNPLLRLELGGIYYQLQQYDAAATQFAEAVRLKPDFANAYYNLGHAYEAKGDLQNALNNYQATLSLVQNNATDKKALQGEIDALVKKIGQGGAQQQQPNLTGSAEGQPGLTAPEAAPSTAPSGSQVKVAPPPTGTAPTPTTSKPTSTPYFLPIE